MVATVLSDTAAQLQALVTDLCKDGSHCLVNFEELLEKTLQRVSDFDISICDDSSAMMPSLENSAVLLWNKTVLLKTKGTVPNATIAKLRHVAFKISIFSCSSSRDETALRKLILMGLKTSRAWIDCKQFDKAESILIMLNQMTQTLKSGLVERANRDSPNMDNQSGTTQDKPSLEEIALRFLPTGQRCTVDRIGRKKLCSVSTEPKIFFSGT
ncbi:uncharacterized protein LOC112567262 isoform X1 [Pomacea canaliculata]|uniref:uncharacterized protein LOC112567262 isoform X1 n=1 Tax=Pomacea canaliculata TaxID=400727 RepID=UPI000D73AE66|nr:uncharacterized protein LOC112567262 isoform X1 [Pomacea canaliculata]